MPLEIPEGAEKGPPMLIPGMPANISSGSLDIKDMCTPPMSEEDEKKRENTSVGSTPRYAAPPAPPPPPAFSPSSPNLSYVSLFCLSERTSYASAMSLNFSSACTNTLKHLIEYKKTTH
eukprot:GHVR01049948.1.p2 GENE.GHVR01049948.1~~GHVR01049948.1.p2  ORF type:complete len:119 (-),score=22.11 GHVR01049948.1:277-633(-)